MFHDGYFNSRSVVPSTQSYGQSQTARKFAHAIFALLTVLLNWFHPFLACLSALCQVHGEVACNLLDNTTKTTMTAATVSQFPALI